MNLARTEDTTRDFEVATRQLLPAESKRAIARQRRKRRKGEGASGLTSFRQFITLPTRVNKSSPRIAAPVPRAIFAV